MNEQIKEIHKQAFDWVQYQLQIVGSDHPVTQKEQLDMVNQKFGELIIEECGVALSPMLRDMISRGKAFDLIKEHFGVNMNDQDYDEQGGERGWAER